MPTAVPPVCCHAVGRDRRAKRTWQPPSVFSTSELRRPRRELQPRGRFTLSPGLGAGTPLLTYACAFRCRPLSAHETQPTGRKPGSGLHAIASTTTPVRASGRTSAANDVDDSVSGDITQGGGLPLTRTEPPRVPRSPVHLMRSPHRARRPPPATGGRSRVGKKIQRTFAGSSKRTGVLQPGEAAPTAFAAARVSSSRPARSSDRVLDRAAPAVLNCPHVFDHRGEARAHGPHVPLRHAVLLLRLSLSPAPARRHRETDAPPPETFDETQPHGIPPDPHRPAPDQQRHVSTNAQPPTAPVAHR